MTDFVWGIRLTPNSRPSTSLTVSEVPFSATDPLGAMKRASSGGARKETRVLCPSSRKPTSSARPSTWPVTMCPPSSSPARSGRSRLTSRPGSQEPSAVFDIVSADTSASNQPSAPSATVRQTPSQAMEAPAAEASIGAAIRTRMPEARSTRSTRPTSVTIPVNMSAPPSAASFRP